MNGVTPGTFSKDTAGLVPASTLIVGSSGLTATALAQPVIDAITNVGTPGATTYTYVIVEKQRDGSHTQASAAVSTATGNAVLDNTNKNQIEFTIAAPGIYDVYRTVGGTTQGRIYISQYLTTPGANALTDAGQAGDAAVAPTTNTTGLITGAKFVGDGSLLTGISSGGDTVNVETISANKTLTVGVDKTVQLITIAGDYDIVLDTASATEGAHWIIRNASAHNVSNKLTVKQGAATIDTVTCQTTKEFIFDGTNWRAGINTFDDATPFAVHLGSLGSVYSWAVGVGHNVQATGGDATAVGYTANAATDSTALGSSTSASSQSVAVGKSAYATGSGVAIGNGSHAEGYGVSVGVSSYTDDNRSVAVGNGAQARGTFSIAIGQSSTAFFKDKAVAIGNSAIAGANLSIALGSRSNTTRKYEMSRNAEDSTGGKRRWDQLLYKAQTTDATPVEMFLGDTGTDRFTLEAAAGAIAFKGMVTLFDSTNDGGAGFTFEGVIKRTAGGTVSLVSAVTPAAIGTPDASLTTAALGVTADNTNKALVLTITGVAATTIEWVGVIEAMEYHA